MTKCLAVGLTNYPKFEKKSENMEEFVYTRIAVPYGLFILALAEGWLTLLDLQGVDRRTNLIRLAINMLIGCQLSFRPESSFHPNIFIVNTTIVSHLEKRTADFKITSQRK